MEKIPCQMFYNLESEEECELDRLDNKLDETHEPVYFLDEAEHLKFLQEKKGWSIRKISRHTGINKSEIGYRLQISKIPEEAKKYIRLSTRVDTFYEGYFREICKLKKDPHIIAVCAKIAERGELSKKKIKGKDKKLIQPMKQSEISELVQEYLEKENQGLIETAIKTLLPQQLGLFPDEEEDVQEEYVTKTFDIKETKEEAEEETPQLPPGPLPKVASEIIYKSPEGNFKGVYFERFPRWVKLSGLIKKLGYPAFMVMKNLGEYDLWYMAGKEGTFYLSSEIYGDPLSILAEGAGVTKSQVQKTILPKLEEKGYIEYEMKNGRLECTFKWDALIEVYRDVAFGISFKEGGLKDIPAHFTGIVKPTHFHHLRVIKGNVVEWFGRGAHLEREKTQEPETVPTWGQEEKVMTSEEKLLVKDIIEALHIERKEAERVVGNYPKERIEKALKLAREKHHPAGWFLTALKENYALGSVAEEKDLYTGLRKEANNCFRNCGGGCASDFTRYDKEKDVCFWCSKFDSLREKIVCEIS
jgi:hypothetical protein